MAVYMPPIARKKRVSTRYNPDTFRVISVEAEESHPVNWPPVQGQRELPANPILTNPEWNAVVGKPQVLPHPVDDYRANKPHPAGCGFLRHNVALLNEPICTVYTDATNVEQDRWWPSRTSNEPLKIPLHTKDTIYRQDFYLDNENSSASEGQSRHASNPNKKPALGVVPVNFLKPPDGKQRLLKENISFEHLYNCRLDRNYPIRAKRHGSFVWQQINPEKARAMIDYHTYVDRDEARATDMQSIMSPGGSSKGSPKRPSTLRSPTFIDHFKSEKLPQSPARSVNSLKIQLDRKSHDESNRESPKDLSPVRSPTYVGRFVPDKLPQSPTRSLTSVELKQNSRHGSGIHLPSRPSIAHYPVIPSVQDSQADILSDERNQIDLSSPVINVSAQSRKRATPLETPISAPVQPHCPDEAGRLKMDNTTKLGSVDSAHKSVDPLNVKHTVNLGDQGISSPETNVLAGQQPESKGKLISPVLKPSEPLPVTLVETKNSGHGSTEESANANNNVTNDTTDVVEA